MMSLTEEQTHKALRTSIFDGAFATVMGSLCGGIFLVGFALNVLSATTLQVGILAALPVSANMAQILGSIIIERFGHRRPFCIICVTVARLFWLLILLLPLPLFQGWGDARIWFLVLLVGLSCLHGSMSGVAWLGWMSDLIPVDIRGRFFAKRNIVAATSGMVATLAGGAFLNYWEQQHGRENPVGYLTLFGIGLVFGLISSFFLSRVPDPKKFAAKNQEGLSWKTITAPLKDRNFRSLLIYVSLFMFVTQMAGPFYSVYMIEFLEVDFSTITLLITFATLASLFMLRIWGPIADQMGNKPILVVAGFAHALIPLAWVVAQDALYYEALVLAHILSGMFHAAIVLAHVNILIKLSPETGRSFYIAAFNTLIGLSVALAPILGGILLELFSGAQLQIGQWQLNNLHLLFLLSGGLQILVLLLLGRLHETGSASSRTVLLQLRNDLDPQTGIASATDFVTIRATQTTRVFKKIDTKTDDWAAHSEARVEKLIDLCIRKFRKPVRFLLDQPPSSS
ncbi:MAG: MFS transporter [Verrucomicrobia bacterium]|nr:MFS transporter [Verrucomicrobiota bacterium]MCH8527036.1 MFS transporter [Kiritimatiellia bacterium]